MIVKIDVANTTLETERLILRGWLETDLDDLYEYASVDGVGEMAGWPHHESLEISMGILQTFIARNEIFAIEFKENNKVIGSLGIENSWARDDERFKHLGLRELGYAMSKDYWGRGIMPEAVRAVIKWCFEDLGLDAVTCGHFSFNDQSRRVIEKCGFTYVDNAPLYATELDTTFDEARYILYRS